MGMADPWANEPKQATLKVEMVLERALPEEELTCLFCWGRNCEWDLSMRLPQGRRVTVGVHEDCRAALEKQFGPKDPPNVCVHDVPLTISCPQCRVEEDYDTPMCEFCNTHMQWSQGHYSCGTQGCPDYQG